jgi:hypothetical protein
MTIKTRAKQISPGAQRMEKHHKTNNCIAPLLLAAALAASSLFLQGLFNTVGAEFRGKFQTASCDAFTGWVCDNSKPATPMYVEFYIDGQWTLDYYVGYKGSYVLANINNPAAEIANQIANQCGGNSAHGFSYSFPYATYTRKYSLFDGRSHKVTMVGRSYDGSSGDWHEINPQTNSQTITCAPGSYKPNVKGSLESANCTTLSGWVCDARDPALTMWSEFYLDNYSSGYIGLTADAANKSTANQTRNDIASQCGGIAEHGFTYTLPKTTANGTNIFDGQSHQIFAAGKRYDQNANDWNPLSGNPSIQCAACVPNCAGKSCGSDGCGGSCGTCAAGQTCNASGQCVSGCVPQTCQSLNYHCGIWSEAAAASPRIAAIAPPEEHVR